MKSCFVFEPFGINEKSNSDFLFTVSILNADRLQSMTSFSLVTAPPPPDTYMGACEIVNVNSTEFEVVIISFVDVPMPSIFRNSLLYKAADGLDIATKT